MRPVLFIIAWISFTFGIIGAFLPIIPTTPFLILSAYLFSKSSPRFHTWLLNLPLAGQGIRDWQQDRVIRPRAKILCASMILLSLVLLYNNARIPLAGKVTVTLILIPVGIYVVSRKSKA